ncbi:MAG TPA: right-handed parallel beta-helix repeat-containing protein, partial [Allosphingosinicella sp.]
PHGAVGTIARNAFVQGKNKENYSALIFVAGEGVKQSSNGLVIADNEASIAPGGSGTSFVADMSGDKIRIESNRLASRIALYEKR